MFYLQAVSWAAHKTYSHSTIVQAALLITGFNMTGLCPHLLFPKEKHQWEIHHQETSKEESMCQFSGYPGFQHICSPQTRKICAWPCCKKLIITFIICRAYVRYRGKSVNIAGQKAEVGDIVGFSQGFRIQTVLTGQFPHSIWRWWSARPVKASANSYLHKLILALWQARV